MDMNRDKRARRAALAQYAKAHDHFSEQEQISVVRGNAIEAAGFHEFALIALRAYRAELDDPKRRVKA